MKRILWSLLILVTLVAGGCGYNTSAGTNSGNVTASAIAGLDLSASKLTLQTNGADKIDFVVYAKDASNAAMAAGSIAITCSGGLLSVSSVTTDALGKASFSLGVGSEKANKIVTLTLTSGSVVKTQVITITGTTLVLTANKWITTNTDPSPLELTASLRDAASQPISGTTINFSTLIGNTLTPINGNSFASAGAGFTDSAGLFKVKYSGNNVGDDTVTVAGSGVSSSVNLKNEAVSLAFFGFITPADPTLPVQVNTSFPLSVDWTNNDGTKATNKVLTFFVNKGYFGTAGTTMTTAATNAAGVATVQFSTGATAGPVQVDVFDATTTQTTTLSLKVQATTPTAIDLQVTPGVIPVSSIATASTATLKATVRDANDQAVAGKVVGFNILQGPGSGEFISPVTAITDNGGIATSTFTSGSGASAQDGVEIQATVAGVAPAKAKMTIAQSAATVTIGVGNTLERDGTTSYKKPFPVLVTNSSGGAVEGVRVTLSLVPLRFRTGSWGPVSNGSSTTNEFSYTGLFRAEDEDRNYILGPNEDCAPELNPDTLVKIIPASYWNDGSSNTQATVTGTCTGNGRLDPGAVASIDPIVTTGTNGMAVFYIYYPKNFGNWVDVEITAATDVTGTNASAKIEKTLTVLDGDTPYLSSPFGY